MTNNFGENFEKSISKVNNSEARDSDDIKIPFDDPRKQEPEEKGIPRTLTEKKRQELKKEFEKFIGKKPNEEEAEELAKNGWPNNPRGQELEKKRILGTITEKEMNDLKDLELSILLGEKK